MNNSKFLIAFDSSDASFRAVDYAGQMLPPLFAALPQAGARLALLFVERLPDRDFFATEQAWQAECAKRVREHKAALSDARKRLEKAGVPSALIDEQYLASCASPFEEATVCSTGESVVEDILRIQYEGNFGTVIVGKRGVSKTEAFLFGSVSNRIIQETVGCTVWVVG